MYNSVVNHRVFCRVWNWFGGLAQLWFPPFPEFLPQVFITLPVSNYVLTPLPSKYYGFLWSHVQGLWGLRRLARNIGISPTIASASQTSTSLQFLPTFHHSPVLSNSGGFSYFGGEAKFCTNDVSICSGLIWPSYSTITGSRKLNTEYFFKYWILSPLLTFMLDLLYFSLVVT